MYLLLVEGVHLSEKVLPVLVPFIVPLLEPLLHLHLQLAQLQGLEERNYSNYVTITLRRSSINT